MREIFETVQPEPSCSTTFSRDKPASFRSLRSSAASRRLRIVGDPATGPLLLEQFTRYPKNLLLATCTAWTGSCMLTSEHDSLQRTNASRTSQFGGGRMDIRCKSEQSAMIAHLEALAAKVRRAGIAAEILPGSSYPLLFVRCPSGRGL